MDIKLIFDILDQFGGLFTFLTLIIIGYFFGTSIEKKHYNSIISREKLLLKLPVVTIDNVYDSNREIGKVELVYGNVVVSVDYYKKFIAGLKNLFGGRLSSYETLIDRAKREAILRMKEMANGCDIILDMRIESSSVGKVSEVKSKTDGIEVIAYGTAITYR
jgi:uncharacterized protein YbjQ (UPF0145 family)